MADHNIKNVFISHVHEDDEGFGKLRDLLGKKDMTIRDGSINSEKPNEAKSRDYIKSEILAPRIRWAGTFITYILVERGYSLLSDALTLHWSVPGVTAAAVVAGPAVFRYLPIFQTPAIKKTVFKIALLAAGIVVPLLALACFYLLRVLGTFLQNPAAPAWSPLHYYDGAHVLGFVAVGCGLFALLLLNVNLTGPHKLYRDQLSKTFVQASADDADLPLSFVNSSHGALAGLCTYW